MSEIIEKEKQVEISRLEYSILEYELKYLKKQDELKRLEVDLQKVKDRLKTKKEGK